MYWRRLPPRIKIIAAIGVSILLTLGFYLLFNQKKTSNPVQLLSYVLQLEQTNNFELSLENISIKQEYAPDYQTSIPEHYYAISIRQGDRELFRGRTVKQYTVIKEKMFIDTGSVESDKQMLPLGKFTLRLPWFQQADNIVFYDESGEVKLQVDLKAYNLEIPPIEPSCGDGICSDDENILMCHKDCSF